MPHTNGPICPECRDETGECCNNYRHFHDTVACPEVLDEGTYEGGRFYLSTPRPPFLFTDKDFPERSRYYKW